MSIDPRDFISTEDSECCGGRMTIDGMCLECGEHCEPMPLADDEDNEYEAPEE